MGEKNWSEQQLAIFEWFRSGWGNLVVRARAGTGKTTTIIQATTFAPAGRTLLCAFNKRIAVELQKRLAETGKAGAEAKTLHGVGMGICLRNWKGLQVDDKRGWNLAKALVAKDAGGLELKPIIRLVAGIASKAKGMAPFATPRELENIAIQFDLTPEEEEEAQGWTLARVAKLAKAAMEAAAQPNVGSAPSIDFDDMLFAPVRNRWVAPRFDLVVVDEAQDMNATQLLLAQGLTKKDGRMVIVGDDRQCQPAGTSVTVVDRKASRWNRQSTRTVPIEDLQVGDRILAYNLSDSSFYKNRRVMAKTSCPYKGKLVTVTTSTGLQSRYTPDHICVASFKAIRAHYGIYLMRKGDFWRVGMTRLKHPVGVTGLRQRLMAEGADEVWLLDTRASRTEALLEEARVAATFGLPTMMFTTKNNSKMTQDDLNRFWSNLSFLGLGAARALRHFGRERRFPMVSKDMPAHAFSVSRPREVRACNLLSDCLVLPYSGKTHARRSTWVPVSVSRTDYDGPVYSLEVEGGLYTADGIVTHNCIYGFRGADTNAFNRLKEELDAKELNLNVTYRCPKAIVAAAQVFVPDFQAAPSAPEGIIRSIFEDKLSDEVQVDDFVLSRKNAPLVKHCLAVLRAGKRARIEGRDIGATILALVRKQKARDLASLAKKLNEWHTRESRRLIAQMGGEEEAAGKISALTDTRDTIMFLSEDLRTVAELEARIEVLFSDNGMSQVVFSSVHKAKGLEAQRVFTIEESFEVKNPRADLHEEANIRYVALTRSKNELVYVCKHQEAA